MTDKRNDDNENAFIDKIKSFDFYRQLPNDINQTTYSGACLSIICALIMAFFLFSELNIYLKENIKSEMFIDVQKGAEKLQVNVDIVFPRMPCHLLSVDIQDAVGSHSINVGGNLFRRRIDKNGKTISDELHISDVHAGHIHSQEESINIIDAQKAFTDKEGCQLYGFISVRKVPGNFHISSHAFGGILGIIMSHAGLSTFDYSHKINHLSFGNDKDLKYVQKNFNIGSLSPIDKTEKLTDPKNRWNVIYQYYLQVVPTIYTDSNGKNTYISQFTSNVNTMETDLAPALYFRYELQPMTVKYTKEKESFTQFIVQICAIIGGVFTILSFLDSIFYKFGGLFKSSKNVKYTLINT